MLTGRIPGTYRRRQPDHVMLLVLASLVAGTWLLRVAPAPNSLSTQLPAPVVWAYYLLLAFGAVTGWLSVWWSRLDYALLLELASRWALFIGTLVFALAALGVGGKSALLPAAFFLAWSGTSGWRALQIVADLRRLRSNS